MFWYLSKNSIFVGESFLLYDSLLYYHDFLTKLLFKFLFKILFIIIYLIDSKLRIDYFFF